MLNARNVPVAAKSIAQWSKEHLCNSKFSTFNDGRKLERWKVRVSDVRFSTSGFFGGKMGIPHFSDGRK